MPRKGYRSPAQKLSDSRKRSIDRRFKQHSKHNFNNEKYYGRYKVSGRVPRRKGKPTQTQIAISRHYAEYVRERPLNPRQFINVGSGKTHKLGPDLIFNVWIGGSTLAGFKASKDKRVQNIYRLLLKTMRIWFLKVVNYINVELIGDPRTFGAGSKGLFPRGGTGYMRRLTRAYIEVQRKNNTNFPFNLRISVPVEYASYLNDNSKLRLAHSSTTGYRIVDYKAGKPQYRTVHLNDPSAITGFYEETIERARRYAGMEFVRSMFLFGSTHNQYLSKTIKVTGLPLKIDRQAFGFSPTGFENSVPYLGIP